MPKRRRLDTGRALGRDSRRPPRTGRPPTRSCWRPCSASSTSSAPSRRPCSSSPAKVSCTGPPTRASARRAARSARSSACAPRTRVNGSHRGHHQFLAKAITHVSGGALDLDHLVTDELQAVLQRTLAEILGLAQGYCRGRGGSMHLQWFEAGALGTNAIVGGGVPLAAGNAWAQKHSRHDRPHRHLLRRRRQPNRLRAGDDEPRGGLEAAVASSSRTTSTPCPPTSTRSPPSRGSRCAARDSASRLAGRRHGPARGAPGDGARPSEHMRSGEGPAVIEAEVYRFFHQNGPYPGSAFGYRTKDEEARGAPATRSSGSRREMIDARPHRPTSRSSAVREQAQAAMRRRRGRAARGRPREGGQAPHPARAVARSRLRRRRRARRRQRARRHCAALEPHAHDGRARETSNSSTPSPA